MTTPYRKKSWQDKLADKEGYPKIIKLERRAPCYNAVHKMGAEEGDNIVLANPSEITRQMKNVPKGKVTTIIEICKRIAEEHRVKACCTLTAGIFISTAANAIEEAAAQGKDLSIPYWRTLKADGYLNEKYPGGVKAQEEKLAKEGLEVIRKGKRYLVKSYQNFIAA